jgi:3D (Asp-Asp-Asp) domain-containing protein
MNENILYEKKEVYIYEPQPNDEHTQLEAQIENSSTNTTTGSSDNQGNKVLESPTNESKQITTTNDDTEINKIGGRLQIVANKYGHYIRFLAYGNDAATANDDWAFIINNQIQAYSKEEQKERKYFLINEIKLLINLNI